MKLSLTDIVRVFARPLACCAAVAALQLCPFGPGALSCAAAELSAENEGAEVLTRGPVHEAFAGTVSFKPTAGITLPKGPPPPVDEIPPDQRPDGDNVTWIPGYWAWDDESGEFLWVSGIWRNLPPGRQWIPGYWSHPGEEYQLISGYWADAAAEEVEYLAAPPATLEAGPNIASPSLDHTWIPGCWIWHRSAYRWRPGYWETAQPGWVWMPSYYTWSPHGHIYVDGYWDYAPARRGMIFAPVRFIGGHYTRPGYRYRPLIVINVDVFIHHLFLRPRHCHYYFGDYYDAGYRRSGYYPCQDYYSGGHGYDPVFAYARWEHRHDDRWERRIKDDYVFFRENRDQRPPHTLVEFEKFTAGSPKTRRVDAGLAVPLTTFAAGKEAKMKFKQVNEEERQKYVQRGRELLDFSEQRKKLAVSPAIAPDTAAPATDGPAAKEPARAKIPRSPLVAKIAEQPAAEDTPPKRREFTIPEDKPAGKQERTERGTVKPAPETVPSGEPGGKTRPKMTPKREPKSEPAPDPRPAPKTQPGAEPGPQPKLRPKSEPKIKPKAEPGIAPQPKPKAGPAPQPKAEPRIQPKTEPRIQPKTEPRVPAAPPAKGPGKHKPTEEESEKPGGKGKGR